MYIPIILTVILLIIMIAIDIFWKTVLVNLSKYEEDTENTQAYKKYKQAMKVVIMLGIFFIVFSSLLIMVVVIKKI